MSTRERKMRKRAGIKFERNRKPAKALSFEQWSEVERFGLHRPEDTEHVRWGLRFITVTVLVAVVVTVGLVIVAVTL